MNIRHPYFANNIRSEKQQPNTVPLYAQVEQTGKRCDQPRFLKVKKTTDGRFGDRKRADPDTCRTGLFQQMGNQLMGRKIGIRNIRNSAIGL